MPAQIYKFPERRTYYRGYKIPLYTEEQIFLTVISLNIFGNLTEKVTEKTLEEYELKVESSLEHPDLLCGVI